MKKYKIFILAFVALILAFSCFTGFVSVPTVRAEYEDGMFPPFTADNYYIILDFTQSNIPLENIGLIFLVNRAVGGMRLDNFASVGYVYCVSFPRALVSPGNYDCYLDFVNIQDLDYIGFPSFAARNYFDINDNPVYYNDYISPNVVSLSIEPSVAYTVIYIDNPLNTLRDQYYSLSDSFRTQQLQLISETSRANQAEANYNNLLTQYNDLNSTYEDLQVDYNSLSVDYRTLQSDYNTLDTQYQLSQAELEEALELAETYQRELREVTAQNERLQELVNNLPPTDLAFGWVGTAFATLDSILSIEIIPNISIGSLVLIPLILGVLFFVLRLVRGE